MEQKNVDLREILEQIEMEKKIIKDNVTANVDAVLLPALLKLKSQHQSVDSKYIKILQNNLEELASSFASRLTRMESKLAPREIEICNLIKNGLTSKEIADLLNIDQRTVDGHRNNIRKKLGISHKDINLTVYLQTLNQ